MAEQDLYRIISTGATYLYLFDEYWYITDPATLYGVFGANPDITDVSSLQNPTYGPQISGGSCLWQPMGSQSIYFLCASNHTAYGITSMDALNYYQFLGALQTCSNQVINDWFTAILTYGDNISMPSALIAGTKTT